jgi:hypothetical protein
VGFKVRLGLRDRGERQRQRNKETKIRRNRADKKNPEQSRVAHLVFYVDPNHSMVHEKWASPQWGIRTGDLPDVSLFALLLDQCCSTLFATTWNPLVKRKCLWNPYVNKKMF